MDFPPGFNIHLKGKKVCNLKKTLYGLKQSPWAWFRRFSKVMITAGYKATVTTPYLLNTNLKGLIALLVYVDDIILIGNDLEEREALK